MRSLLVCIACSATACAGGQRVDQGVAQPDRRSWAEHMHDAAVHDRLAEENERAFHAINDTTARLGSRAYYCGDPVLNDQLTTGGTGVTTWQPCFDVYEESLLDHRAAVIREREAARRDRQAASALAQTENTACRGIPARELGHSPFAHRKEIASVMPHRQAGLVRGVWIVFKPVPGMTADWLRRDIDCARARWATLGKGVEVDPDNPTLVPGATVEVLDRRDHLEVLVTTLTTDAGELAYVRAQRFAPQSGPTVAL